MMADLLIRKATKGEVDAVRTLVQTVIEETYAGTLGGLHHVSAARDQDQCVGGSILLK